MRLAEMKCGDTAKVVCIEGEGQLRKRILDLGLTCGVEVKLIRIAPLGDPVEIELRGYRLTVRKSEASIVVLEACSPSCSCDGGEAPAEEPVVEEPAVQNAEAETVSGGAE
ncbi:MAG: ferrous iron transport protein A [Thermoplasmata archaeon]|nr:ferrous iron transport protein A [Thermoplasmata archaeon]